MNKCIKGESCLHCNTDYCRFKEEIDELKAENERLKENQKRCAFKCLSNTFCDEARIKIDKLKLDRDCLNASLETSRKYRGIAETDRDLYKQALQEIRDIAIHEIKELTDSAINGGRYLEIIDKINEVIGE